MQKLGSGSNLRGRFLIVFLHHQLSGQESSDCKSGIPVSSWAAAMINSVSTTTLLMCVSKEIFVGLDLRLIRQVAIVKYRYPRYYISDR